MEESRGSTAPEPAAVAPRRRPIGLFLLACCLLNLAIAPLLKHIELSGFTATIRMLSLLAGLVFGQCCFVVLWSSLTQASWLAGYLHGLLISVALFLAVTAGAHLAGQFDPENLALIALLPLLLLAAGWPLHGFRKLRGWHLVHPGQALSPGRSFGIEDLLAVTSVLASAIVLARLPLVVWEEQPEDYWPPVLISAAIASGFALVFLPASTWCALRRDASLRAVPELVLLSLGLLLAMLGLTQCFYPWSASVSERLEVLPLLLLIAGGLVAVYYSALAVLRMAGMRLLRPTQAGQPNLEVISRQRRRVRWGVAMLLLGAAVGSAGMAYVESWRAQRDAEIQRQQELALSLGGSISVSDRQLTVLSLGDKAGDQDLARFAAGSEIRSVNLLSPHITNRGIEALRHFRRVKHLTLFGTAVTDEGLQALSRLAGLESLDIRQSQLNGSGLRHLANRQSLRRLTASQSQFDDRGCEALRHIRSLAHIDLRDTHVTDAGVAQLARLPALLELNLGGTQISGVGLGGFSALHTLQLDGTALNDAGLQALRDAWQLRSLMLNGTPVTDEGCVALSSLPRLTHVELSETAVTDEGLRRLGALPLLWLDLRNTRIDGSGFQHWTTWQLQKLVLDNTNFRDESMPHLLPNLSFDLLSLQGTQVTDASLPYLAKLQIDQLDLRYTRITAAGLLAHRLPGVRELHLAGMQFTAEELSLLQTGLGVQALSVDDRLAGSNL